MNLRACFTFNLILAFSILCSGLSQAESAETVEKQLWAAVDEVYNSVKNQVEKESSLFDVNQILGRQCSQNMEIEDGYLELIKQSEYWDKNYGVELRGGVTTGDLESSQIEEDGTTYLELSWDILKNGYQEYNYKARDFQRKAELERVAARLDSTEKEYQCRGFQIGLMFIGLESFLATNKLSLLENVYSIERKAYFEGASYFDELLISEEELVNVRQKLQYIYSMYGESSEVFSLNNPPVLDLKIVEILSKAKGDSDHKKLFDLKKQSLAEANPYEYGSRVRVFVRKEFDVLSSRRDDLVAGVRFSIPLTLGDEPTSYHRVKRLEQEESLQNWQRLTQIRQAYESFREHKERTVTQKFRYLRSKERMRRIMAKRVTGDALNISAVVARLNTFVNAAIELIEVKKELYTRANRVFLVSGIEYSPELVEVSDISAANYRSRDYQRSIYLWSKAFNQLSPEQIVLFLRTKGIETLLLSASSLVDHEKLRKTIALAQKEGVRVDTIIGDNSWIEPRKWNAAVSKIAVAAELSGRIHLDIEPQALDDYQDNKQQYQTDYINLLKEIRKVLPDQYISVAVPFHWEKETYENIAGLAQAVYVMNYGSTKIDTLARRTKNILRAIPVEMVSVVLSLDDFNNEYELENAFKHIHQLTGVSRFGMHQMSDFMRTSGAVE